MVVLVGRMCLKKTLSLPRGEHLYAYIFMFFTTLMKDISAHVSRISWECIGWNAPHLSCICVYLDVNLDTKKRHTAHICDVIKAKKKALLSTKLVFHFSMFRTEQNLSKYWEWWYQGFDWCIELCIWKFVRNGCTGKNHHEGRVSVQRCDQWRGKSLEHLLPRKSRVISCLLKIEYWQDTDLTRPSPFPEPRQHPLKKRLVFFEESESNKYLRLRLLYPYQRANRSHYWYSGSRGARYLISCQARASGHGLGLRQKPWRLCFYPEMPHTKLWLALRSSTDAFCWFCSSC